MEKSTKRSLSGTSPEDQNTMHAKHLFLTGAISVSTSLVDRCAHCFILTLVARSIASRCIAHYRSLFLLDMIRYQCISNCRGLCSRGREQLSAPLRTSLQQLTERGADQQGIYESEARVYLLPRLRPSQSKPRVCSRVDNPATGMHVRDDHQE
jgi:hypothetical protein